jgi:hypothetical protein
MIQVPLKVHRQAICGLVAARAVLLDALHNHPFEIAAEVTGEFWGIETPALRGGAEFVSRQRADTCRRPLRFLLANGAAHFVETNRKKFLRIEGSFAR